MKKNYGDKHSGNICYNVDFLYDKMNDSRNFKQ